jgi:hypothetical protein
MISMKNGALVILCALLILSSSGVFAHDRKVGILIDATCGKRLAQSPDEAKAHLVSCCLKKSCAKSGFGVIVDGKFYKFDKMGDKLAAAILESTDRKSGVRVRVDAHFDADPISPGILETIN